MLAEAHAAQVQQRQQQAYTVAATVLELSERSCRA